MMILIAPVINEQIYVNRKNTHSINVQLMCESDMRISNASYNIQVAYMIQGKQYKLIYDNSI